MKLSLVTETFPPEVNGVAMTIGRLVAGMAARGHEVHVVRPSRGPDDNPAPGKGIAQVLMPGSRIPGYPGLRFGLPAYRRLIKAWRANPPDLVHVATEGPLGWSAVRAARRLEIPVTSSFHTNFHAYGRHYRVYFVNHLVMAYLKRFHNRTLATFAPTREICMQLEASGMRNLRVMGRGVDVTCFSPEHRSEDLRLSWKEGAGPVVMYVGRMAPEKNIPLAIRAFQAFQEVCPGARLVLVGSGPMDEALRREHPEFVFAGVRRGADLAAHYASADLFIFPSLTETYGNVVVEAMASALPVLAFNYAAPREHICSWRNGVTVAFGDEDAFVAAARILGRRVADLPTMGRAARAATEGLGWDRVIDEWEESLLSIEQLRVEPPGGIPARPPSILPPFE